jgi:hypothetical protein
MFSMNPIAQPSQAKQTSKANKQSKQASKQTRKLAWVSSPNNPAKQLQLLESQISQGGMLETHYYLTERFLLKPFSRLSLDQNGASWWSRLM